MKRLLLLALLTTSAVRAEDFSDTLKKLNSYRVTSGVKAVATGILGIYAGYMGCLFTQDFGGVVRNLDRQNPWRPQAKNLAWTGVGAGGMFYTSYQLLFNYCWPYTKHALSIK